MNKLIGISAISALLFAATPALAHNNTLQWQPQHREHVQQQHHYQSGIHQRHQFQRQRIRHGIHSGAISRGEARMLHHEVRHIHRKEYAYRADGHFSRGERHAVHRDMNRVSVHINAAIHDGHGYR